MNDADTAASEGEGEQLRAPAGRPRRGKLDDAARRDIRGPVHRGG